MTFISASETAHPFFPPRIFWKKSRGRTFCSCWPQRTWYSDGFLSPEEWTISSHQRNQPNWPAILEFRSSFPLDCNRLLLLTGINDDIWLPPSDRMAGWLRCFRMSDSEFRVGVPVARWPRLSPLLVSVTQIFYFVVRFRSVSSSDFRLRCCWLFTGTIRRRFRFDE